MATNGTLTPAQRKALAGPAISSPFDVYERLFPAFDQGTIFDFGEWDARQLKEMLRRDGNARKIEQVLTLPIRSAEWTIEAAPRDRGEAKLVREQLSTKLPLLIAQMCSGIAYRKAFFEVVWSLNGATVGVEQVAYRPATSCEAGFDPQTGQQKGFRQRIGNPGGLIVITRKQNPDTPGYVKVPAERAFIYVHGAYREPIQGTSDLDVALWAWETKQKLMFLWFQYLEGQSLPKLLAYGDDLSQAEANRDAIAEANASAVIAVPRNNADPAARMFDVLESSGKGSQQFAEAISYLDGLMTASVLAGFTDLAALATHVRGQGSYALSADQSEFFLSARQAVADEMADQVSSGVFGLLCRYNFGPDAAVPSLRIGPLSKHEKERALAVLQTLITAPYFTVPAGMVDLLITSTAGLLGLPADKVAELVKAHPVTQPPEPSKASGATISPDRAAQNVQTQLAHTVDAVHALLTAQQAGVDIEEALALAARHQPGEPYRFRHGWIPVGMAAATTEHHTRLKDQHGIKVPPGWSDVHVAEDPTAKLQVIGRDTKGRVQRVYSREHAAGQAAAKFRRVHSMHKHISSLDAHLAVDAPHSDHAAAVLLMRRMGLRPGSEADTGAEKKAHGATNLRAGHVTVAGDTVRLRFTGKKGVDLDLSTRDPHLASVLAPRLEGKDPNGRLLDTSEHKAAGYLRATAPGVKLKDLRTYHGNDVARRAVAEHSAPTSQREFAKARLAVARRVAAELGNTPAVALASYIDPDVFARWARGLPGVE